MVSDGKAAFDKVSVENLLIERTLNGEKVEWEIRVPHN